MNGNNGKIWMKADANGIVTGMCERIKAALTRGTVTLQDGERLYRLVTLDDGQVRMVEVEEAE